MTRILLPRSTPEAQGLPSAAIADFVDEAERTIHELHSIILLRHGEVVAEGWWQPYERDRRHMLFSLSKSFTSTAIGLLVAEGRIAIDTPVVEFFPDHLPAEVGSNLAAMRVRHLLSMSTGHADDTTGALWAAEDGNWPRAFLAQSVEYAPGTHFLYNTGATYMLSAILQRVTGETLLDYLRPRLLEQLGITDATWETDPRGVNTGGFGLSIPTEGIAAFGQLYLQEGVWQGRQLVPRDWVAEATRSQIDNRPSPNPDWAEGYGYQFWMCRHNGYRGDGAFGQFCVVLPEQDAVVAITSGVSNMQAVLDLIWARLLPAMGAEPLPDDAAAQAALRERLAALAIRPPQGVSAPPLAQELDGRRYRCAPNELQIETIAFAAAGDALALTIRNHEGDHEVRYGSGAWLKSTTTFVERNAPQPVAGAGAWSAPDTFMARLYYYETPFCATHTYRFDGDQLTLSLSMNVSFGPTEIGTVSARLVED